MTTKKTLSFSQMLQAQIDKAARKRGFSILSWWKGKTAQWAS
jgi:hypothetical protein